MVVVHGRGVSIQEQIVLMRLRAEFASFESRTSLESALCWSLASNRFPGNVKFVP
jgi:hypothetical protein